MTQGVFSLQAGDLKLRVRARGGAILRFDLGGVPLLRPAADDADPVQVACFPMAPLGNRIRDNLIRHGDQTWLVTPNVPDDPLHLHGESWLADWRLDDQSAGRLVMSHRYEGPRLPHRYHLRQTFNLTAQGLSLRFDLTNTGDCPLPFGFGWHPFFPLSPGLRITTAATTFWTEGLGHLPQAAGPVPAELDFAQAAPLPAIWINNAFEGWSGRAELSWQDRAVRLVLQADPLFGVMQLYRPTTPGTDFFALEPMSHLPGTMAGLRTLHPGESLSGGLSLCAERLSDHPIPHDHHRRTIS